MEMRTIDLWRLDSVVTAAKAEARAEARAGEAREAAARAAEKAGEGRAVVSAEDSEARWSCTSRESCWIA